jgi:hypothetical protein
MIATFVEMCYEMLFDIGRRRPWPPFFTEEENGGKHADRRWQTRGERRGASVLLVAGFPGTGVFAKIQSCSVRQCIGLFLASA